MVFNGEIYNYEALRRRIELEDPSAARWRGHSDTEVMLAAISLWGVESALQQLHGMFAFGLWDRSTRTLYLARDRIGEKPVYYGEIAGVFAFASELSALESIPRASLEVDPQSVSAMLQFGYVPAPHCIYKNIFKLEAGTLLRVGGVANQRIAESRKYWMLDREEVAADRARLRKTGQSERIVELHDLITQSIKQQMIADVPIGSFLSGGIDSSAVTALMCALSTRPVHTFTIGFQEEAFDEAKYAKRVAKHLGTQHTELYVTARDALNTIPDLPHVYDEPFADSSQVPTLLLSRLTRKHVTVALSGDGGDELFAGYPRYQMGPRVWRATRRLPAGMREFAAHVVRSRSARQWDQLLQMMPSRLRRSVNGQRLHRFGRTLLFEDFATVYERLVSQFHPEDRIVLEATAESRSARVGSLRDESLLNRMRWFDLMQYLPDNILVKIDRASMSASLETRAPFLDPRIVEFSWALPEEDLIQKGRGKWILRQILARYVPNELIERPKSGFSIPLGLWLRRELRDWAADLLDERRLRGDGLLAAAPIGRMWHEHLSGAFDRSPYLWNVLMLQAWLQARGTKRGARKPLVRTSHS